MKRKHSFTIIELMVVIVIMAIITTSVAVSFSVVPSRKLRAETLKLVSDMSWIRMMAKTTERDYVILLNPIGTNYFIYEQNAASWDIIKRVNLDVDEITLFPAADNFIRFYSPKGDASWSKQINLRYRQRTSRVNVYQATGGIEWE